MGGGIEKLCVLTRRRAARNTTSREVSPHTDNKVKENV